MMQLIHFSPVTSKKRLVPHMAYKGMYGPYGDGF